MWPICSATNPILLVLPFLLGLATAWWAWRNLRKELDGSPARRRRRTSRRLRKARREMGDPFAHLPEGSTQVPADIDVEQLSEVEDNLTGDDDAIERRSGMPVDEPAPAQSPYAQEVTAGEVPLPLHQSPGIERSGTDDLLQIKGIGPSLQALLHSLGISRFDQIAAWDDATISNVDSHLGAFSGRIRRDHWIEQARLLAAGATEEFERRFGGPQ